MKPETAVPPPLPPGVPGHLWGAMRRLDEILRARWAERAKERVRE